jgi:acetylornithine deacetylase/succinyl-diaminopimelate desuccinylase-like protein
MPMPLTDRRRVAAEAVARRSRAGGFADEDVQGLEMPNGAGDPVARYRAREPKRRPVLFVGHLDVVEAWPAATVLPSMATGATDGLYLRNAGIPTYTFDFLAEDPDDDRIHGNDERIRVDSCYAALDLWHRSLLRIGQPQESTAP